MEKRPLLAGNKNNNAVNHKIKLFTFINGALCFKIIQFKTKSTTRNDGDLKFDSCKESIYKVKHY